MWTFSGNVCHGFFCSFLVACKRHRPSVTPSDTHTSPPRRCDPVQSVRRLPGVVRPAPPTGAHCMSRLTLRAPGSLHFSTRNPGTAPDPSGPHSVLPPATLREYETHGVRGAAYRPARRSREMPSAERPRRRQRKRETATDRANKEYGRRAVFGSAPDERKTELSVGRGGSAVRDLGLAEFCRRPRGSKGGGTGWERRCRTVKRGTAVHATAGGGALETSPSQGAGRKQGSREEESSVTPRGEARDPDSRRRHAKPRGSAGQRPPARGKRSLRRAGGKGRRLRPSPASLRPPQFSTRSAPAPYSATRRSPRR